MADYKIKFNKKRCISCQACEVHCKMKNRVPVGIALNRIECSDPAMGKDGTPEIKNKYVPCMMCKNPDCMAACPTGAIIQREDGLVLLVKEECIGCGACVEACPFNVMTFDEAENKAMKCDYCLDRIEQGLDPACVTGCTTKALSFVRP